jgi:anthranilate phosphoribosyltransferase
LVSQYQDDGTMGKALSTASSGGVDINALAAAVWAYATRDMPATERDAVAAAVIAAAQATPIDANIKEVNDTTIDGAGTAGDPWGPA